jgi:hypothetical protein
MNLESFLDNIKIEESNIETDCNSMEPLEFMIQNKSQGVIYTCNKKFVINNISIMEVNRDGFHMFSVPITGGHADIVYNISSNVICDILLNDVSLNSNTPIVLCNGIYTDKKIRFYLDPNNLPEYITLTYKIILLNSDIRKQLTSVPILYAGNSVCRHGVISRR